MLPFVPPPQTPIYRLGRAPDPWQPPDWASAASDGAFVNRFDDPEGMYRVIYASSQRLGCYLETLARFRVDLTLLAELNDIAGENDFVPLGVVPAEWPRNRVIGSAQAFGRYADVYHSGWIGHLRGKLASIILNLGLVDMDAAVLQSGAPRALTQQVSRVVYEEDFEGIYYRSRYGHEIVNWALFEPFLLEAAGNEPVVSTDPDFLAALQTYSLRLS